MLGSVESSAYPQPFMSPYYCTPSPTLIDLSTNVQKGDILPGCSLFSGCDATGEPLRKGDFLSLAHNAPFGLAPNRLRGVATGRFIAAHAWNGHRFLKKRSRFCVDMQRPWCHSEKMPRSRGRFGVLWGHSPASHRCKERHIKSEQHQRPSTQLRLTTLCDFASLPSQRIPEIGNFCALAKACCKSASIF